ncbi:pentapeptide repeat-containing protein [Amycolatopsis sp. A133]|uniref:pentapeptide repeat-containing protein n=1 Tax=Amycolatopsis sp. A133 TaxID=3064472 RepID=UPI0027EC40E9|nr:pentapeptide repeat-containing protein [Amycolatopsis sp. A133]MDQ7806025.1 pentapeptide repeat-containing protein [Amycolatopsis sp. A133]
MKVQSGLRHTKKNYLPQWPTVLTALTALLSAIAAALSVYVSSRSNDQTIRLTEQGQVTQRYATAIELIGKRGDEFLQTRLGGIYALERLARDSPADQPTIVEVLSAYVRTTAPVRTKGTCAGQPLSPVSDVQAAIAVLGRRNPAADGLAVVDLHNTCLGGVAIGGVGTRPNFARSDLRGVDMTGADVAIADFDKADFRGANLGGARFEGVQFAGAFFADSDLRDVTFVYSAVGRPFADAAFSQAKIDSDTWDSLIFYHANLQGAERSGPNR